ncbi:MAG: hypothetical protein ED556_09840 [Winogradskyella sp.]|uniref:hypothetical protein n=1 Tax=Winogradskyella sp. TaxID=1883156 RepID=UPI000F3AF33A|nr:hypothetical protein [Winogradskyella sp.]RNC84876.1 MAG: hypothetical protein ED556_09840 [Winogradskyella sp.]
MNDTRLEKILGKDISDIKAQFNFELKENNFSKNDFALVFHSNESYINEPFYNMFYNHISIITNKKDKVQSITIHFREIIDYSFFNSFIENYGEPNSIQVIENRKRISKTTIKDEFGRASQTLTKNIFDLREGTFEEKPLHIIWQKSNFQIKVFLRHEQNISEITFSNTLNEN